MMNRLRCVLLLLLQCYISLEIAAQSPVNIDFVPPSPTAMAMTRVGNVPVDYYTGRQQFSVPLWKYEDHLFSWPVSVDYVGGNGIKVEEIASNVGLGFSLSAGGVISRVVYGLPDDQATYGWIDAPNVPESLNSQNKHIFENYHRGAVDSQPDVFSYSVGGSSGKFFIGKDGLVNKFPENKHLLIQYSEDRNQVRGDAYGRIYEFRITDASGYTFVFADKEYTRLVQSGGANPPHPVRLHVSSWQLSRIIYPFESDTIEFDYEEFEADYQIQYEASRWYPNKLNSNTAGSISLIGQRLISIQFPYRRTVSFEFDEGNRYRCDFVGEKALRSIAIVDGDLSRKFVFTYIGANTNCQESDSHDLSSRLFLDKIQEVSGEESRPPWQFYYEGNVHLPPRDSRSQDHWGYYNGAPNNTLVPRQLLKTSGSYLNLTGGNRNSDSQNMQAGILKKVVYPTGGYTKFEYEANQCYLTVSDIGQTMEEESLNGLEENKRKKITIKSPDSGTWLKFEMINYPFDWDEGCAINFAIKNDLGEVITSQTFSNGDYEPREILAGVMNGEYHLEWSLRNNTGGICEFEDPILFKLKWVNEPDDGHRDVGGLRIKKIVIGDGMDAENDITREFTYENEDGVSSGHISCIPKYDYQYTIHPVVYTVRTATSALVLNYTRGNLVGYQRVLVEEQGNGLEEFIFTTPGDFPDVGGNSHRFPFAPDIAPEWSRGLMLNKRTYRHAGGSRYDLVQSVTCTYANDITLFDEPIFKAVKVGIDQEYLNNDPDGVTYSYRIDTFQLATGKSLISKELTTYKEGNDSITHSTTYFYEPGYDQVKAVETSSSDDETYITKFFYPFDYASSASEGISLLSQNHVINKVVNEEKWVQRSDGESYLIQSSVSDYSEKHSMSLVSDIWSLAVDPPVSESDYGVFDKFNLLPDPAWFRKVVEYGDYTVNAQPLEFSDASGLWTVLLWGHGNKYLVARIRNARFNTVLQALGTNTDFSNGLSDAQIALLKTEPLLGDAHAIIYQYEDGYGIKSIVDPNNRARTYGYDDLGRLIQEAENVNGMDHIIKKYQYNYKTSH